MAACLALGLTGRDVVSLRADDPRDNAARREAGSLEPGVSERVGVDGVVVGLVAERAAEVLDADKFALVARRLELAEACRLERRIGDRIGGVA
jgi:hypothetical protein